MRLKRGSGTKQNGNDQDKPRPWVRVRMELTPEDVFSSAGFDDKFSLGDG
jgi:hypothetical protein